MVPAPIPPVIFVVPVSAKLVPDRVAVAFTVIVVLNVAADAAIHPSSAEARSTHLRIMVCFESSNRVYAGYRCKKAHYLAGRLWSVTPPTTLVNALDYYRWLSPPSIAKT